MIYYSVLRPVGIGTFPKKGFVGFKNYETRKEVFPGFWAWGELYYKESLTGKELSSYDLSDGKEKLTGEIGEMIDNAVSDIFIKLHENASGFSGDISPIDYFTLDMRQKELAELIAGIFLKQKTEE